MQQTLDKHWAGTKDLHAIKRAQSNVYSAQNQHFGQVIVKATHDHEGLLQETEAQKIFVNFLRD